MHLKPKMRIRAHFTLDFGAHYKKTLQPPPKPAKHSQSSPALIAVQNKYAQLTNNSMAELLPFSFSAISVSGA